MTLKEQMGEKVHHRKIDVSTYQTDGRDIIVEGELHDKALKRMYRLNGEMRDPHTIHNLIIRIRVNHRNLAIDEIETEMPGIPHGECSELKDSLAAIKGFRIAHGFTPALRRKFPKGQGCTHLMELLLAMAHAAIQGYSASMATRPIPEELKPAMEVFLTDTCWVWRKDGPTLKQFLNNTGNEQ